MGAVEILLGHSALWGVVLGVIAGHVSRQQSLEERQMEARLAQAYIDKRHELTKAKWAHEESLARIAAASGVSPAPTDWSYFDAILQDHASSFAEKRNAYIAGLARQRFIIAVCLIIALMIGNVTLRHYVIGMVDIAETMILLATIAVGRVVYDGGIWARGSNAKS